MKKIINRLMIFAFVILGLQILNSSGLFNDVSLWILYPFLFIAGWCTEEVASALEKINNED